LQPAKQQAGEQGQQEQQVQLLGQQEQQQLVAQTMRQQQEQQAEAQVQVQQQVQDAPRPSQPRCCSRCGASRAQAGVPRFKVCAGCNTARYCGSECQRAHWLQHRALCQQMQQAQKEMQASCKTIKKAAKRVGRQAALQQQHYQQHSSVP
jgi:hypothetical protein